MPITLRAVYRVPPPRAAPPRTPQPPPPDLASPTRPRVSCCHECRWRFLMPTRSSLTSVFCAVLLAVAIPSTRASAQSFFMTPIPNAAFSGVVNIEQTIVRKDGSVMQLKSTREVARDTRGRIHNELRALIPVSSTDTPELLNIHLYDPQTRISTQLDVRKRTFWTITMNHP